jgi:hypothetical protein
VGLKLYGREPSSVYVAVDTNGWHKVGHTAKPTTREYHLSRERGCPVRMVHIEPGRINAEYVEVTAHWLLAEHENTREWFKVDAATAIRAVEEAREKVDAGHLPHSRFAYERRKVVEEEQDRRVRAALTPGETMQRFIRKAVEAELTRRERK